MAHQKKAVKKSAKAKSSKQTKAVVVVAKPEPEITPTEQGYIQGQKKVSDAQFFHILRECAGLYARTARLIEHTFGIKYSRQAVKYRAERHLDILEDIQEESLDLAEEGLHSLMRDVAKQDKGLKRLGLDATEIFLKAKGKKRGYFEKREIEGKIVGVGLDSPKETYES